MLLLLTTPPHSSVDSVPPLHSLRAVRQILEHDLHRFVDAPLGRLVFAVLGDGLRRGEFGGRSVVGDVVVSEGEGVALGGLSVGGLENHLRGRFPLGYRGLRVRGRKRTDDAGRDDGWENGP